MFLKTLKKLFFLLLFFTPISLGMVSCSSTNSSNTRLEDKVNPDSIPSIIAVAALGQPVALTMSHAASLVIREELGIDINPEDPSCLTSLFDPETVTRISYYPEREMTAPIASGSFPTKGMVVIPASTTSFAKIAMLRSTRAFSPLLLLK